MKNSQVAVVGAGNMGKAIAWAMESLGYDVMVLDQNERAIFDCQKILDSSRHTFVRGKSYEMLRRCPMVISSLPYHQNLKLATFCIDNGIKYFDLGGSVGVSEKINEYAKAKAKQPVMTDLGLAPGWVNIEAESLYTKYVDKKGEIPNTITMMVGGLPQKANNTLKYSCTWSYAGLINEYRDDCIVLVNGLQDVQRAMNGLEESVKTEIGELEAFYTSGGAAHTIATMQRRKVQNCWYKTLRYPGHHKIVNFLVHESGLDDETLTGVFKRTCPPREDLVIIRVVADDLLFEKVIRSDQKFSAMQKATAFPIAAAAHTVASYDVLHPVLKYDDLGVTQFNTWLDILFLQVD
jgi:saccharopine dehydrogenase-like NADP-dependent oxidoreductase